MRPHPFQSRVHPLREWDTSYICNSYYSHLFIYIDTIYLSITSPFLTLPKLPLPRTLMKLKSSRLNRLVGRLSNSSLSEGVLMVGLDRLLCNLALFWFICWLSPSCKSLVAMGRSSKLVQPEKQQHINYSFIYYCKWLHEYSSHSVTLANTIHSAQQHYSLFFKECFHILSQGSAFICQWWCAGAIICHSTPHPKVSQDIYPHKLKIPVPNTWLCDSW